MSSIGLYIADAAKGFVGTPFRHQGRSPGIGLDCAGVALCAAWDAGLEVPDFYHYGIIPDPDILISELGHRCLRVREAAPGDLLLFSYRRQEGAHFAVWDGSHIVHAYEGAGSVVRTPLGRWQSRIHSRWRFKGIDEWHP